MLVNKIKKFYKQKINLQITYAYVYSPRELFKFLNMNKNITVRLSVKIITENIKYS